MIEAADTKIYCYALHYSFAMLPLPERIQVPILEFTMLH